MWIIHQFTMKNAGMVFRTERKWKKPLWEMIIEEKKKLDKSIHDFPFPSCFPGFVLGYPFLRESTSGFSIIYLGKFLPAQER